VALRVYLAAATSLNKPQQPDPAELEMKQKQAAFMKQYGGQFESVKKDFVAALDGVKKQLLAKYYNPQNAAYGQNSEKTLKNVIGAIENLYRVAKGSVANYQFKYDPKGMEQLNGLYGQAGTSVVADKIEKALGMPIDQLKAKAQIPEIKQRIMAAWRTTDDPTIKQELLKILKGGMSRKSRKKNKRKTRRKNVVTTTCANLCSIWPRDTRIVHLGACNKITQCKKLTDISVSFLHL
jgi:hypothetical protein